MTDKRRGMPPALLLGCIFISLIFSVSVLALLWVPHDLPMNLNERFASFSQTYPLGTDHYGRDLLSMIVTGLGYSFLISMCGVLAGSAAGIIFGFVSSFYRNGFIDSAMTRISDFIFAFPGLLVAVILATLYGPSIGNVIIALAIFNIPVFYRLARNSSATLFAQSHLLAARALGQSFLGLFRRHILPGSASILLTQASIQLGFALLTEATLSYLGLGVPPEIPSLGRMLQEAQVYMYEAPRLAVIPGLAIAFCVLAFNLLGDGLRDRFDIRRYALFS